MTSSYYNAVNHIFGTKNSDENPDIFLLPGKNQTLNISGASFTPIGVSVPTLSTTDNVASTSKITGSLKSAGGLGVVGDIYADKLNITNVLDSSSVSTGSIITAGGVGIAKKLNAARAEITDTTSSTSKTTGSLINDGGFGNAGAIFTDTLTSTNVSESITPTTGSIISLGGIGCSKTMFANNIRTSATTSSTSTSTGSIVSAGGIACAERIFTNDITVVNQNYSLITFFPAISHTTSGSWINPFTTTAGSKVDAGTATSSTTAGVVTINTTGVYTITYGAAFGVNGVGIRGYKLVFVSGNFVGQTVIGTVLIDAVSSGSFNTELIWSMTIPLIAGNQIRMDLFQNSTAALNTTNNILCVARQI